MFSLLFFSEFSILVCASGFSSIRPNRNDLPLLLQGLAPSLLPPPPINAVGARIKGKWVDFDASAEQPVQKGRSNHSAMVGQAALMSSSRGLGTVAREYLRRAPVLYEEFLTEGLSQHIEEDKGSDLCYTLVRHALMVSQAHPQQ
ncbi:hypothetical protein ACOSQ4_003185 [Xanthoceras sorbifolium]